MSVTNTLSNREYMDYAITTPILSCYNRYMNAINEIVFESISVSIPINSILSHMFNTHNNQSNYS